jgi:hypothetical protein
MSTVARPSGPLPARVYWVRRLALLAVVLLVGWLMIRWVDGGGSGAAPPEDESPAAATQTEDATESTDDQTSKKRDRTPRIRTVAESFERPREACDLTKVVVSPSVAEPAYAGEPSRLTLRISSSSSQACSLAIDTEHLLVSITSGHDDVWDSTRCEDEIPARELALQPRWSALVELTWSGLYSGRHCASDSTAAEPGSYTVEAAVLEGEPTEAEFELVERPESPEDESDEDEDTDKGASDDADESDEATDDSDTADESDEATDDSGAEGDSDSQGSGDTEDSGDTSGR